MAFLDNLNNNTIPLGDFNDHKNTFKGFVEEFIKKLPTSNIIYSVCPRCLNDAFGTIHRSHASNAGIANILPSGIGFLVKNEVDKMKRLIANSDKPNYKSLTKIFENAADNIEKEAKVLSARTFSASYNEFESKLGEKYQDWYGESLEDSIQDVINKLTEASDKLNEMSFEMAEMVRDEYPEDIVD